LDREVLAGYHGAGGRVIPQVRCPDRGLQIAVRVSGEELAVVRGDVFGRSGILRSLEKLLLESVVSGRGRR
jgi:hypothetical protein